MESAATDTHLASSHGCCPWDFGNQGYHCLPLALPAPTTPEAQLVISKEKRNWYQTTVPVFLPAFLFNKKECQKQTLYPQGMSRFLSSTSCNLEAPFLCFCFRHMFSAATVHMFITLFFWLFSNKPSFRICFSLLMQSS